MDKEQLIKKIISRMLRDQNCLPLGLELLNYDIRFINLDEDITVFKGIDIIYINKNSNFLKSRDIEEGVTFLLLHEVCHILFFHDLRKRFRNSVIWHMATDYMVNALLLYLRTIFDEALIKYNPYKMFSGEDPFLFNPRYKNMLEEEIYDELIKKSDITAQFSKDLFSKKENTGIEIDDLGGIPQIVRSRLKIDKTFIKRTDVEVPKKSGRKASKEDSLEDDLEDEAIKKDVKGKSKIKPKKERLSVELKKRHQTEISRLMFEEVLKGHAPRESMKFLNLLFGVKVDWKRILRDSLNTALDRSPELTWGKPRLSWLVNVDHLPYLPNYTEEEKLGTLIVSIDESASMSDEDVSEAIEVVCQAKDKYKKLYIIKHDVDVNWTKEYEEIGDSELKKLLIRRHCGGTSHKNVFKEILRYLKSRGNLVSAYIAITDMESDIEGCQDMLPHWIPKIYLTNAQSFPRGIIGKIINVY